MHEVLVHMRNIADGGEVDIPQRPIMDTIEEEEADPVTAAGQPQSTGKAVQTSPAISPAKPAPLRNPASTQGSKLSRISSPQTVSVDEKPDVDFDGILVFVIALSADRSLIADRSFHPDHAPCTCFRFPQSFIAIHSA